MRFSTLTGFSSAWSKAPFMETTSNKGTCPVTAIMSRRLAAKGTPNSGCRDHAVHSRHLDVHDHRIGSPLACYGCQRFLAVKHQQDLNRWRDKQPEQVS